MHILEMKFVNDFCKKADLKVISSKKLLNGNCVWLFAANSKLGEVSSARLSSDEHNFLLSFVSQGRVVNCTFDMSLNLKSEDIGKWEENQEQGKTAFQARVRTLYPSPLGEYDIELDTE